MRHPLADRDAPTPGVVTGPDGTDYPVDADGRVDCPEHVADALEAAWADRYDLDTSDPLGTDTCEAVKADGEVCGRELPCPYHTGEE